MVVDSIAADKEVCGWPISGRQPIVFSRDDLKDGKRYSKHKAWALLQEGYPYLEMDNFAEEDTLLRYYFLSLGLLDYAAVIISGLEGSGKSLFQAWCVYQIGRLFGKQITIDWSPPIHKVDTEGNLLCPIELRNAHRLQDEEYITMIQDGLNKFAKLQKQYGIRPPEDELKKLIVYDSVWGFDESQTWGDKASRTNLTKLIASVLSIRRHIYTSMFFTYIDPSRADKLIYNRLTHFVSCDMNREYYDTCSYSIFHKRRGIAKRLHLRPKDWTHIWDTHSVPEVSHNIGIYLGGRNKPKKPLLEEFGENNNGGQT